MKLPDGRHTKRWSAALGPEIVPGEPGFRWKEAPPLPASFFLPSAEQVAPALLGHWLVRRAGGTVVAGPIVETEAYLWNDPASHAFRGPTARNRSMFGPPGRAYVYFIYGNHWCFNVVCRPEGIGEAVLIRALEPAVGATTMARRRPQRSEREWTNGPAKCCQALAISGEQDGQDLTSVDSSMAIVGHPRRDEFVRRRGPMVTATRVGIQKAADWPLRFYLEKSPWVSRRSGARGLA